MSRAMKSILWSAIAALSLIMLTPGNSPAAERDRYWKKYWSWYENDYQPFYRNYNNRRSYYDRDPYYGRQPYYDRRPYYYRDPYTTPRGNRQYRNYNYRGRGGGVEIGPLQLWW
jgi:hypothetical protein